MGKGSNRRPEAIKGSFDANWDRAFGKPRSRPEVEHLDYPAWCGCKYCMAGVSMPTEWHLPS